MERLSPLPVWTVACLCWLSLLTGCQEGEPRQDASDSGAVADIERPATEAQVAATDSPTTDANSLSESADTHVAPASAEEPADPESSAASDSHSVTPAGGSGAYGSKGKLDVDDRRQFSLDWKDPQLLVVLSGDQHGYLEPCGCAGLDNMKGGLGRRHTLLRRLEASGTPLLALDTGDLVRRSGAQAVIKYDRSINSLLAMKYRAVGFGISDLRLQPENVLAPIPVDGPETPFVSANVGLYEMGDDTISVRYRVFALGGLKLGVTTVLADERIEELNNPELVLLDAEKALTEVVPQLEAANCDRLLLLVTASVEEAEELAVKFPQFDFVVVAGDSDPPPPHVEEIEGTTSRLIELSHKGMYVGLLGFFNDTKQPFRYRRVAIDSRFEDSVEMKDMLAAYQEQLKSEGFQRLGIFSQPAPHGDKFVGSKTCQECHESEFDVWSKSGHAHAIDTLVKLNPPRQFDPECLSCHVTGWEPQLYAPLDSGYQSIEATPHLVAVGCENCHGPGSSHVAMEQAAEADEEVDEDRRDALYEQMRVTLEESRRDTCIRCHDLDNSPDFTFEKYWPKIEH